MTSEARHALERKLLEMLEQEVAHTMPAVELIRGATRDGTSEMDAREALLSLMAMDNVEFTTDWQVRRSAATV